MAAFPATDNDFAHALLRNCACCVIIGGQNFVGGGDCL